MANPFSDQDRGGKGKRLAQTIEGTATEVSVKAANEESAREQAARTEPDGEPGAAGDEGFIPPQDTEERDFGEDGPPPRATLGELKSFVTHLAAGVLGGLVGIIALTLAWGLPSGKTDHTAPAFDKLDQRVAKLESAPAPQGNTEEITSLDLRVKALEQIAKEPTPDLSDLKTRVAQLETSLKTLGDAAKKGGLVADAAAVSQQINEVEQRLQGKIETALASEGTNASIIQEMQSAISELKAKVAALADAELGTGDNSDLGAEVSALSQRVNKLETALPELASAASKD